MCQYISSGRMANSSQHLHRGKHEPRPGVIMENEEVMQATLMHLYKHCAFMLTDVMQFRPLQCSHEGSCFTHLGCTTHRDSFSQRVCTCYAPVTHLLRKSYFCESMGMLCNAYYYPDARADSQTVTAFPEF